MAKAKEKIISENLTTKEKRRTMSYPVREMVLARMKERQWTPYRLAKQVEDTVTPQTVYSFIRGDSDLVGKSLSALLTTLDLVEPPCGKQTQDQKPQKKQAKSTKHPAD